MQRITGKELAVRKGELRDLLKEALDHHRHTEAARSAVVNGQQLALFHAWQAGIRLNKMKELIGHGHWQDWLEANFCKPRGVEYRTAALYMKIDNDNSELRTLKKPKLQRVADLKFDTIRKYAIGFVPDKDQPEHNGNEKLSRLVSFLNMANEFTRLKQRHEEGLQLVDFEEAREETLEISRFLNFLQQTKCPYCNALIVEKNPWSKTATPH